MQINLLQALASASVISSQALYYRLYAGMSILYSWPVRNELIVFIQLLIMRPLADIVVLASDASPPPSLMSIKCASIQCLEVSRGSLGVVWEGEGWQDDLPKSIEVNQLWHLPLKFQLRLRPLLTLSCLLGSSNLRLGFPSGIPLSLSLSIHSIPVLRLIVTNAID